MVRAVTNMRKPDWFDGKINLGNVVSWLVILCASTAAFVMVQTDVKALQAFRDETKVEMARFRDQRQLDREAIIEMRGDVRFIRQLLEQQKPASK